MDIRVYNPMRPMRFNRGHMPWYIPQEGERDLRFSRDQLALYITLVYEANGYGLVTYKLKDLKKIWGSAEIDIATCLRSLCSRRGMDDSYEIEFIGDDLETALRSPESRLMLRIRNVGLYTKTKGFFTISEDVLWKIALLCDRRNYAALIQLYAYMASRMQSFTYLDGRSQETQNAKCFWRSHADICNDLNLQNRTLRRYIKCLENAEAITYCHGSYRKDAPEDQQWSLFVEGVADEIVMAAALNHRENYRRKKYSSSGAGLFRSRKGPC